MRLAQKLHVLCFAWCAMWSITAWSDPTVDYIRANAVQVAGAEYPAGALAVIGNSKAILVGEMHGTQQSPAETLKLVEFLSRFHKSILVGLEIFEDSQANIDRFLLTGDRSLLAADPFFTDEVQDGRRSQAMVALLDGLRKIAGVRVVCIDPVHHDHSGSQERDLGMARNLVSAISLVRPEITLTLTGNCHSKLSATEACDPQQAPMGVQLLRLLPELLDEQNVLSLDLRFESGSFWGQMDDYIGVHPLGPVSNAYTGAVPYDSYILKEGAISHDGYNGALFIRRVSYSLPFVSLFPRVDSDVQDYDKTVAKMQADFDQIPADPHSVPWVQSKLSHMVEVDQFMRMFFLKTPQKNSYSPSELRYFYTIFGDRFSDIDRRNTADLKALLKLYDWFRISIFGNDADRNAWLLVQHADLDKGFQESVLSILAHLWPVKETSPANYAYLYDRVASSSADVSQRKPQLYGTQGNCKGPGDWEPFEIQDPEQLDQRRKEMGLIPFADYKKQVDQYCI